jgi:hypothetical protein
MVVAFVDGVRDGMNVGHRLSGGKGSGQSENNKVAQYGI